MRNARAHKFQWSGPTVHSSTVAKVLCKLQLTAICKYNCVRIIKNLLTKVLVITRKRLAREIPNADTRSSVPLRNSTWQRTVVFVSC